MRDEGYKKFVCTLYICRAVYAHAAEKRFQIVLVGLSRDLMAERSGFGRSVVILFYVWDADFLFGKDLTRRFHHWPPVVDLAFFCLPVRDLEDREGRGCKQT